MAALPDIDTPMIAPPVIAELVFRDGEVGDAVVMKARELAALRRAEAVARGEDGDKVFAKTLAATLGKSGAKALGAELRSAAQKAGDARGGEARRATWARKRAAATVAKEATTPQTLPAPRAQPKTPPRKRARVVDDADDSETEPDEGRDTLESVLGNPTSVGPADNDAALASLTAGLAAHIDSSLTPARGPQGSRTMLADNPPVMPRASGKPMLSTGGKAPPSPMGKGPVPDRDHSVEELFGRVLDNRDGFPIFKGRVVDSWLFSEQLGCINMQLSAADAEESVYLKSFTPLIAVGDEAIDGIAATWGLRLLVDDETVASIELYIGRISTVYQGICKAARGKSFAELPPWHSRALVASVAAADAETPEQAAFLSELVLALTAPGKAHVGVCKEQGRPNFGKRVFQGITMPTETRPPSAIEVLGEHETLAAFMKALAVETGLVD